MAEQVTITINTEEVRSIASQIENDNKNLKDLLDQTKTAIDALSEVWTGPAAEDTRTSYADFSGKFFEEYYNVIDQYVKFLRTKVADDYDNTERNNQSLADAFKN